MRKTGKRRWLVATSVAALLSLGGCVYPAGYNDGYYDGYDGYDDGYGHDGYNEGNYYDGFYDGYYGPYAGGYWAVDGFFYYWLYDRYYRDDHRHFRRHNFSGAYRFRGDRDGPSRWRQPGYQPHQGYRQWPAPANPPQHRPQQGGQQPDYD